MKTDTVNPKTAAGVIECQQTADLLCSTIRQAHNKACDASPVVSMVLMDLLAEACVIEQKLKTLSLYCAKE